MPTSEGPFLGDRLAMRAAQLILGRHQFIDSHARLLLALNSGHLGTLITGHTSLSKAMTLLTRSGVMEADGCPSPSVVSGLLR